MSFIILILWLVFSIAMAVRAKRRNRSPTGWFVLSLLFTPLVTFCALDLLSPDRAVRGCYHAAHDRIPEAAGAERLRVARSRWSSCSSFSRSQKLRHDVHDFRPQQIRAFVCFGCGFG